MVHIKEDADIVLIGDQFDVGAHRFEARDRITVAGERTGSVAQL
jgi:hypothetical protein